MHTHDSAEDGDRDIGLIERWASQLFPLPEGGLSAGDGLV